MCGVPFHSAESYINRLVERGYKVAICEQVEDPKSAKGLVKREVIRVVTREPTVLLLLWMKQETIILWELFPLRGNSAFP